MAKSTAANKATELSPVSNDAERMIGFEQPYTVEVQICGTAPLLFHRWSVDGIDKQAAAVKGSKAKKTDDVESYVYRTDKNELAIPSEYFRQSIIHAAKFRQDPRSPRKSAMDLFKAAVICLDDLCSLGVKEWDYLDRRRVTIQRNGITRTRPAMNTGWRVRLHLSCILPEYVSDQLLNEVLQAAGRLIGVADFRPTYGRFQVTGFKVIPV